MVTLGSKMRLIIELFIDLIMISRMMKARSPNIAKYGVNEHYGTGPYHKVAGFLVENDQCSPDGHGFSQNCPAENRNGFYLNDEMSPDWKDLDQTQILYFHSWVNEYTRVANVTSENGRHKVMFQEPLAHAAVGTWIRSGDLRYIVVNNLAVLDSPGEFVCTQTGNVSTVSWIPPQGVTPDLVPVMAKLEKVLWTGNNNVNVEGLSFQHTNHYGLDTGMDFQHAALTVTNSNSEVLGFKCFLKLISFGRCKHYQLRVLSHGHDGSLCFSQLKCSDRQKCIHRYW